MLSNAINALRGKADKSGFYPLTVTDVKQETRDAIVVTFDVPSKWKREFQFIQGQHLTLRAKIGGEELRRSYSICSAVQDSSLRVAIKKVSGGAFSCWANDHLKPGAKIDVLPPSGHFYTNLSPENRKHYMAFAAGSGITPILSIVKTTLLTEPHSRFTLFYGNRSSNTVIFKEELAELKDTFLGRLTLMHVMTREHQDLELLNGRITAEKCEQLVKHWCPLEDVDMVFLCGPQEMARALSEKLKTLGLAESQIKIELFSASSPQRHHVAATLGDTEALKSEVTIIMDGRHRSFYMAKDNETILDAALRHGIELRYSCKGGVCATCRSKLTSGQVDMDAHDALEDYEVRRGFVLTCQSYPLTEQVTLDFDQDS